MTYDVAGKCAIVTGASSGIGAATAERIAKRGGRVVLLARRESELERVAARIRRSGGECVVVTGDASRRADNLRTVEVATQTFGPVEILVLNAGRGQAQSVEDTTEEVLESLFALNVFALYYGVQAALPVMRRRNVGRIVTVASLAGRLAMPFGSVYTACKHAAIGFSNTLRLELAGTEIHAVAVCPGSVATPWAGNTEGISMLDLNLRAAPEAARIASHEGVELSGVEVLPPRAVADAILDAIVNPVSEVYTHAGSREEVIRAVVDPAAAERSVLPFAIAMRHSYSALSNERPARGPSAPREAT